MPIKLYCDRCNDEVLEWNTVSRRAIIDFEGWQAEVMIRNPKMVWNDGILCENCLKFMLKLGCFSPKQSYLALEKREDSK